MTMKIINSRIIAKTIKSFNPITEVWEDDAQWLPDYFEHGYYGVKFSTHVFDQRYMDILIEKDNKEELILAIKPETVTKRIYESYEKWWASQNPADARTTHKEGVNRKPSKVAAESNTNEMRCMQVKENRIKGEISEQIREESVA